jgi:hypothetical protein
MSQTDDCVIQVHDHKMSTTAFYFKRFLHVAAIQTWMIIIYIYCPAICHLCVSKLPYAGFQCIISYLIIVMWRGQRELRPNLHNLY